MLLTPAVLGTFVNQVAVSVTSESVDSNHQKQIPYKPNITLVEWYIMSSLS